VINTTLNKIRKNQPCAGGWKKLLHTLGKTQADDEPLSLITILDSNGLDDALWCLRAVDNYEKEMRLYAVWCARQMQHLMKDQRSLVALDVAERFANGCATLVELDAACDAAWAATWAAANAARDVASRAAAWAASRAAAEDAAWAAAMDAAWATSWAAANASRAAAMDAAWAAAEDASKAAQEVKFREMFGGLNERES
jgi:hypothetical protein